MEAAHAVFAERGYHAGSFQEIADRVGMSQTGLLYYFPTKSGLLLEVLDRRDAVSAGRVSQEAARGVAATEALSNEHVTDASEVQPASAPGAGGTDVGPVPDAAPRASGSEFAEGVLTRAKANEAIPGVIELYTVLCGESATEGHPARPYFVGRFEGLRASYTTELRALGEQGRLRPGVDPERAAASLIALWDGIQLQWLLDPTRVDVVACLRDYLELLLEPAPRPV